MSDIGLTAVPHDWEPKHIKMNSAALSAHAHIQLFIKVITLINMREGKLCTTRTHLSYFAKVALAKIALGNRVSRAIKVANIYDFLFKV